MTNNDTIAALREIRSVIIPACEFQSGAKVTPDFDEPYAAKRAREAVRLIDNLITQLEQAGEVDKRALNTDALNKAIEVGAEQFGQQMRLGGGSLSEMFTRVIRAYLDAAAPAPKHGN